jgi:hypothetical protein
MSASAIESRNQRDADEWRQRGMFGEVRSVDPATGVLVIESRRGGTVTVATTKETELRRLRPGSVDPVGATPIALGDLAAGDQVAVRALPGADTASVTADRVLAGDFPRRAGGRVVAVDPAKGEVTVAGREDRTSTILVTAGTMTRQFAPPPPEPAGEGAPAAGRGPGGPGREGGPGRQGWAGRAGGRGGLMGFGIGPAERAELEKRTQPLALADLKPGDFVFAVSEPGAREGAMPAAVLIKVVFPGGQRPSRPVDAGTWDILPGSGPN